MNNRSKLILGLAALFAVAAAAGGWFYYTTTPRYALHQAGKAIQNKDWEKFQTYVDVNSLSTALASDMGEMAGQALGAGSKSPKLAKLIGTLLAAKLTPVLRQDIEYWVKNDYPPERKSLLKTLLPHSSGEKIKLEKLAIAGDKGTASLKLTAVASLKVEIARVGDEWKITRILNLPELFKAAHAQRQAAESQAQPTPPAAQ